MTKLGIRILILCCAAAGFIYFIPLLKSGSPRSSVPHEQDKVDSSEGIARIDARISRQSIPGKEGGRSSLVTSNDSTGKGVKRAPAIDGQSSQWAESGKPARTDAKSELRRISYDRGPSIGEIKVLGHRGCDLNTKGWFLSVGNPEQYDFTVSDDGETVVVAPNTPNLTGNFEFIHCADAEDLKGGRVRFSATIKAEGVNQTAQLRLRGEDDRNVKNLGATEVVTGTYDWKVFSIEADVGPEVAHFSYGITFRSAGRLWISHPEFGLVGK